MLAVKYFCDLQQRTATLCRVCFSSVDLCLDCLINLGGAGFLQYLPMHFPFLLLLEIANWLLRVHTEVRTWESTGKIFLLPPPVYIRELIFVSWLFILPKGSYLFPQTHLVSFEALILVLPEPFITHFNKKKKSDF